MRWQPTIIERLEVKHPGLEKDVCDWLKSHMSGAEVAKRLLAKYNQTIPVRTINTYRKIRLEREQKQIKEQKIRYLAIMEIVGEKGLDAGAAAQLWEALQSMTPRELIAMRRVQVERERVELLEKRAENQKQKLKATVEQLKQQGRKGAKGGAESEPRPDPLEIRRRIRAIYGLPDDTTPLSSSSMYSLASGSLQERVEPDESESDDNESEVRGPKSDDQNCAGPPTSDSGPSPDTPAEGGAAPAEK